MKRLPFFSCIILIAVLVQGCAFMEDFTTYFNIYWNADRIMHEVEEPAETADATAPPPGSQLNGVAVGNQKAAAGKLNKPKLKQLPEYYDELIRNPNFDAARRVIGNTVVQRANANLQTIKLDSVVNKCTKILKFHSNSKYVPPALYMLSRAFYLKGKQTDFLYSRQKAEEFIQLFPEHELYVDAHLLLAEDLIALKENAEAERALSRCVDVALPRKRYDVVTKALRYTADLALQRGDLEGAVRPYLNAMLLSKNGEANATWQLEIASLNLITGHNEDAAQAFRDVMKYDPDLYTEFAAQFGLGIAMRQMKQYDAAKKQLEYVRDKSDYADYRGYAEMELATLRWIRGEQSEAADDYRRVDTSNAGAEVSTRAIFEWGQRAMEAGDYGTARGKFEKVRTTMISYSKEAERLYGILLVGDAASRDMITLEARLASSDSSATMPVLNRARLDSLRTPQTGQAIPPSQPTPPQKQAPAEGLVTLPVPTAPTIIGTDTSAAGRAAAIARSDSIVLAKHIHDSITAVNLALKRQRSRDSIRNALANSYYEIGRMYFLLGQKDSLLAYFDRILALNAPGEITPTTLYAYALYLREEGREPEHVDTLMQAIVDRFPHSKFAPMARLHLGLTEEERIDSAETEYISGERFMSIRNDSVAIQKFLHVQQTWPGSEYGPQALYTIGFIFENDLMQYDSAKFYYNLLVKTYPNSEHAKRVKAMLAAVTAQSTPTDTSKSRASQISTAPQTVAGPMAPGAQSVRPEHPLPPRPPDAGMQNPSGPNEDIHRMFPNRPGNNLPSIPPLKLPLGDTTLKKNNGPQ